MANLMVITFTTLWLINTLCIVNTIGQTTSPNSIYYERKIQHSEKTHFQEELSQLPPSNRIFVKYYITFTSDKCCPLLAIRPRLKPEIAKQPPQKFYYDDCLPKHFPNLALYSPNYNYLQESYPRAGCKVEGNVHSCNSSLTLTSPYPAKWSLAVQYECGNEKPLNLTVRLEAEYFPMYEFSGKPLANRVCLEVLDYNMTCFPNFIGQLTQIDATKLLGFIWRALPLLETCYQHIKLLACYCIFPACSTGSRLMPCQKMCVEAQEACKSVTLALNQPIFCGSLIDSLNPDLCYYEPVRCPLLDPPDHGKVVMVGRVATNFSRYSCDEGYTLTGNEVRNCSYSGKWNGSHPECIALPSSHPSQSEATQNPTDMKDVIIPVVIILLIVIVGVVFAIYHRSAFNFLCLKKSSIDKSRGQKNGGRLFITYSSEDSDEVNDNFLPEIKQHLPSWEPITYQLDFTPGRPIMDCIREGVWESKAMLVLLTENYVASDMCKFEFAEAESRAVEDKGFKVIAILLIKNGQQSADELTEELPENLREFIKNRVYLTLGQPFFWTQLKQALSK